ncbi:hypothetical protein ABEB36_003404 [Hypothenemus hampei]
MEELTETLELINERVNNNLMNFMFNLDEQCESKINFLLDVLTNGLREDPLDQLVSTELDHYEASCLEYEQLQKMLNNVETSIEELKRMQSEKQKELVSLQRNHKELKKKIESITKQKEQIQNKRDQILAFKILTGIDFNYKSKKVEGIITKSVPKAFSFNPDKLTQEEIAKKLWNLKFNKE